MLLVICGAGASYDSAPSKHPEEGKGRNLNSRPPLASELFSDRDFFVPILNKYNESLSVVPRLQHFSEEHSVEQELQRLKVEALEDPRRHQQLCAIRYYLQEVISTCAGQWSHQIGHITNYNTLLDDIRAWNHRTGLKACIVTFNYDAMLAEAFAFCNIRLINELSDYISDPGPLLIKLHGSVTWAREVITPCPETSGGSDAVARWPIKNSPTLKISQKYTLAKGCPPQLGTTGALIPALAIPVESKLEFECPADHVAALKSFLPSVSRMLVIGWRGMEIPFLELLKENLRGNTCSLVVGRDQRDAVKIIENLRDKHSVPGEYGFSEGGFTDFIRNREIAKLLL